MDLPKNGTYKQRFFERLRNISPPTNDTEIQWAETPNKLTCCIVEPRMMEELRGVLYNIAKIYGQQTQTEEQGQEQNQTDIGLTIFHGTNNEAFVKGIVKKWKNVVLYNLNEENLTRKQYSELLTKRWFYEQFVSSHVLIFQTDSYLFRQIPEEYYKYDYVGAPWRNSLGNGCGNGGISLRRVKTMHDVATETGTTEPEDVYYSRQNIKVCTKEIELHKHFSVEHIFVKKPVCCHQPWYSMRFPFANNNKNPNNNNNKNNNKPNNKNNKNPNNNNNKNNNKPNNKTNNNNNKNNKNPNNKNNNKKINDPELKRKIETHKKMYDDFLKNIK